MKLKIYIFMSNILVIVLMISCSKKEKKRKVFELNKNIEFNIDNNDKENSKMDEIKNKIIYNFSNKENKLIYNVKSLQLFTSKFNQVLFTISFDINLKKIEEVQNNQSKFLPRKKSVNSKKEMFNYKIYFTNLKIKHKVYYGRINFENIRKKYNLLLKAIYFNLSIDKYGRKHFFIEKKISLNKKFKSMAGFIFNIINNIFIELPNEILKNKSFTITDKKYELTSDFEEDGSLMLKENITQKIINTEYYKNFIIFNSDTKNNKLRILYSIDKEFPQKVNLLFKDKDKLEFEDKEYEYSIKNYYFIEKLSSKKEDK